jgi:glycosyltransferase involved in cell wall biosynthesis
MREDYALKVVPLHLEDCSIVIATSERIKCELMRIAPSADPDRIVVKPNAVDASAFQPRVRPEPRNGEPYRLVCVSRIEPKKGIIYLVDAVRRLLDRGVPVHLRVVGAPDDNDASREYARGIDARIKELGLAGAVVLDGRKPANEVKGILERAHLFIAPFVETEAGDKDGIPTCLLEAMASGLPAVCTDAGSIPEVIEHGEDGVLVPQRDAGRLSEAIEAMLRNPEERARMGRKAVSTIRERFDVGVCEHRFHDRVRKIVSGAASGQTRS